MPKITFSNGFKAEKTNYSFASTYYRVVVKPWIPRVGDNHPEARTAAKNALLIAKQYKYALALLERLIQGLNSAMDTRRTGTGFRRAKSSWCWLPAKASPRLRTIRQDISITS